LDTCIEHVVQDVDANCGLKFQTCFGIGVISQGENYVVRIEKKDAVWTIIHSRFDIARNAMDPDSANALVEAFNAFELDPTASVAVFWGEGGAFCAGWDLKFASSLTDRQAFQDEVVDGLAFPTGANSAPRGPMGPSRLELSKPVIAAVEGPAVAGGMELALWCDIRVMAASAYFGVYCRRWGVPLIDGGSVRLPRLVGQGRAMEIILTGRKVPADEALRIGLCELVVEAGGARAAAEAMAHNIARFPQAAVRADRRSVLETHGTQVREGLRREWVNGVEAHFKEGASGASRFASGLGRHGDFETI
jgi:enoyl-CoA hydratase